MNLETGLTYVPPTIAFDDALSDDLATAEKRLARRPAAQTIESTFGSYASPFVDYRRTLTAEGGILIRYKDIDRCRVLLALRIFTALVATVMNVYLIFKYVPFGWLHFVLWFGMPGLFALVVSRKFEVFHSVEIQPDRMIVDGNDVFPEWEIGPNWPRLEYLDECHDRAVIAGLCGTRYVEYMTANRCDDNDFTPEILEADLLEAMTQLWDRTEVSFDTAP